MANRTNAMFVTTSANFTAEQAIAAVTAFFNVAPSNALHKAAIDSTLKSVRFVERDDIVAITADVNQDDLTKLAGFVEAFQTMSNATRDVRVGFIVGAHNFPNCEIA